jgi:hypothetical protein
MSAEHELNAPPSTAERAPTAEYVPMPDPIAPEPEKRKEYDSDLEGVQKAARDLTEAREHGRVPQAEPEIDRGYQYLTGDKAGERVPENQTLEAQRAARDLKMMRDYEAAVANPTETDRLASAVDNIRQAFPNKELPANFVEDMKQVAEHVQQQQSQIQTDQQPAQDVVNSSHEQPALPDGVDPDIANALSNPKIRAALEAEVQAAEQARIQFAQGARQAAQLAAAAVLSNYPELANLNAQELPHAVNAIRQVNPQKAMEIETQLNRAKSLYDASQQAENAQRQIQAQRIQEWAKAQDHAYDAMVNDSPETKSKLGAEAIAMLKEYGATDDEIAAAWHSPSAFRSAVGQRVLRDAAAYRLAQREAANKVARPVPPVQRPGTAPLRNSDGDVDAAMKHFRSSPSVDSAVALLQARRNSRR